MLFAGPGDIEWGTVPAGIAALGTVCILMVSVSVFVAGLNDRRRAQAEQVCAWWKPAEGDATVALISYRNGSDQPVYDFSFRVLAHGVEVPLPGPFLETLGPGAEDRKPFQVGTTNPPFGPVVTLAFRDAAGRTWQRDGSKLKRVRRRRNEGC